MAIDDQSWSEGQRAFVRSLEQLGATRAEHAVAIDKTAGLPVRELKALVDSGVVREAAANGYYIYPSQKGLAQTRNPAKPVAYGVGSAPQSNAGRILKSVIFFIIVILLPIIVMHLLESN
jgi:hypothetical protein